MDEKDKVTNKLRDMQHQIRQNAMDTQSYLADLQEWEKDIRKKDIELLEKSSPTSDVAKFPVRNAPSLALSSKAYTKKCAKKIRKETAIKSSDYQSWDKFDADKACDNVDNAGQSEDDERCGSECECDRLVKSDEEIEREARLKRAEFEKSKGNEYFERGKYKEAVECYSKALSLDDKNAIYFANRAMAALKLKRFSAAEEDCCKALNLNPIYVKAFHRRATARLSLKNLSGAKQDFAKVLSLEPNNKDAKEKLGIIKEWEERYLETAKGEADGSTVPDSQKRIDDSQPGTRVSLSASKAKEKVEKVEKDSDGRIRVYPLPTSSLLLSSDKPLRKLEIRDVENAKLNVEVKVAPLQNEPTQSPFRSPNNGLDFSEACACLFRERNHSRSADYIQQISPSIYGKLIGQNLSREIFSTITTGAVELSKRGCDKAALDHLTSLVRVPRFSFFVHGLTSEQKNDLLVCFEKLLLVPGLSSGSAEVVRATATHFLIKL